MMGEARDHFNLIFDKRSNVNNTYNIYLTSLTRQRPTATTPLVNMLSAKTERRMTSISDTKLWKTGYRGQPFGRHVTSLKITQVSAIDFYNDNVERCDFADSTLETRRGLIALSVGAVTAQPLVDMKLNFRKFLKVCYIHLGTLTSRFRV
jgi:hypothetical protein